MDILLQHTYTHLSLKRNEYLKRPGSRDTNLYYIEQGTVRIFVNDGMEEQNIRFGYADNYIAALDSYISEEPSALGIQAIKACRVAVMRKKDVQDCLREHYQLWIQLCEDLLLQQMERELDLLCSSARERYERVLARSPRLFQEIPHKHIANYLRMSPETLSRLRNLELGQDK